VFLPNSTLCCQSLWMAVNLQDWFSYIYMGNSGWSHSYISGWCALIAGHI
jgi:hypothetical protein